MAPACSESTGMARILGSSCRLVTPFDAAVQSPQGQPPLSQRTLMAAPLGHGRVSRRPLRHGRFSHRDVFFFVWSSCFPEGESGSRRALAALFLCCWQPVAASVPSISLVALLFPNATSRGGSSTQTG
ncbi:hypothetical protein V8C42DRAFT_304084 [Trichoderma barbatum]